MVDLLRLEGVKATDYRSENGYAIITVQPTGEELTTCPKCGGHLYKHGVRKNLFSDTPMQMQPVKIEVKRQRYRCSNCKSMITPELSFINEKRRSTDRLIKEIRRLCLDRTFTQIAEDMGVVVNTVKNITIDYIKELEQNVRFETPTIMGVDELKLMGTFRCVITNLSMNTLYDMLPGRTQDKLIPYFQNLPDREKVEWICTDMWRPFKKSFFPHLPNAKLVIDKFHVVRMANVAMEEERKAFQNTQSSEVRLKLKKNLRWVLVRRPDTLNESQIETLEKMRTFFPKLTEAYDLKEEFFRIYDAHDKSEAIKRFQNWQQNIPKELLSFKGIANTVNRHAEDIFAYWDAPIKLTNAYTESHNGLIRVANRMGRGYSFDILRAKMLYNKVARNIATLNVPPIYIPADNSSMARVITQESRKIEFGSHIPSLNELYEPDEDDEMDDILSFDDWDFDVEASDQ